MKLVRLHIEGFRGFAEQTTVNFNNLDVFVGRNDVGKSSLFDALNIFFGESKIDQGDVNTGIRNTSSPSVVISCEFTNYPDKLVIDASNRISPREEYLLNSNHNIHIRKKYTGKSLQISTYLVAKHPIEQGDLLELNISELKTRAKGLNLDLSNVNQSVKADIRHAIWDGCRAGESLEEKEIPIDANKSKGEFKSIEKKLREEMPIFALFKSDRQNLDQDPEAQNPLKSAVKEILKMREQELDQIAYQIKEQLQEVADKTVEKIQEMSPEIAEQLTPNIGDPSWEKVFKISLTSEEEVPVNKRGSGVRRLILLNFFRVKAEERSEGKNIIYAIEEPETSQHPDHQKMLISALEDLANRNDCQVFVTTHTPMLTNLVSNNSLHYVKIDNGKRKVIDNLSDEHRKEIIDSLGILPDNRVKLFLFVEGKNDIDFLKGISKKLLSPDLSEAENKKELIFLPMGGSNLQLWSNRLSGLNKKEIYIYDRDNQSVVTPPPGSTRFQTVKKEMENYIHPNAIMSAYKDYNIEIEIKEDEIGNNTDVPNLVAQKVYKAKNKDNSKEWDELDSGVQKKKQDKAKRILNKSAVERMTQKQLKEIDGWEEIKKWMCAIKECLV